ncbi:type II toxin-antitoxin system RelE/ParE family toxin [Stenoxybacter acetivorans]|uniref:type II toxin-antitoxin system RelE/ParE family toxin n=1 Tax=Stenoxybacter acetivorans TaxID=422441 RepID=UPI00056A973F|nr:type II toxin-antitoxin system RelE/ParE family toxin [Stenoxybacter acetivorans]
MLVNWSNAAHNDLNEIVDYIALDNIVVAENLSESLFNIAEKLGQMPYIGRNGRVAGTREFVAHPNYIIVYKVKLDELRILRVLHGKRKYP